MFSLLVGLEQVESPEMGVAGLASSVPMGGWTKLEVGNRWSLMCFIWAASYSGRMNLGALDRHVLSCNHTPLCSLLSPQQPISSTGTFTTWALLALNCLDFSRGGAQGKRNMGFEATPPPWG